MEIDYLLAPPGALGGVAFQKFLITSSLSSNPIRPPVQFECGPTESTESQRAPESPRQSQTVPDNPRQSQTLIQFPEKFLTLTIFHNGNRLFISTARCSRRSSVSKISDNLLLILKIPSNPTVQIECSKWSKWVLNGFIGSSNGPRQSQRVPDNHPKFQKNIPG